MSAYLTTEIRYEPFRIHEQIDAEQRYRLSVDSSFPLAVKLFDFPNGKGAVPMTWHERLELFCPVTGSGAFRMGDHVEPFAAGDILLIDNLRLHGVESYDGALRTAVVVAFFPMLIAGPGALPCDNWLLRPFFHQTGEGALRLQASDPESAEAREWLEKLVRSEAGDPAEPARQSRSKLALMQLLLLLERAWRGRIADTADYEARRERLRRLAPLFDHLQTRLAEPMSVAEAARLIRMSPSYFMQFFRAATGMPFASYVEQLRITRAHQLLVETDMPLAEIAAETGFCDQCHMTHRIRRRFGLTPARIRTLHHHN